MEIEEHKLAIMYGLLIQGVIDTIRKRYGEEMLAKVKKKSGVDRNSFVSDKKYSERTIPRLTKGAYLECLAHEI